MAGEEGEVGGEAKGEVQEGRVGGGGEVGEEVEEERGGGGEEEG